MKQVKFKQWICDVSLGKFYDGTPAIRLHGAEGTLDEFEPIATASAYVADLADGEVAIKNYSENEGMLNALVEAGIVSEPLYYVTSGYVQIPICTLLI